MFFTRRKWALRVTEAMSLKATDERSTELVSMIIQGSKQFGKMSESFSKPEQVLMAAAALINNESAIRRYTERFNCERSQTIKVFDVAKDCSQLIAFQNGFAELLQSKWFK